ncbi:MAG: hypothetical protein U0793_15385 [Gemmataceae bacterium]
MRFLVPLLVLCLLFTGCDGSAKKTDGERSLESRLDAALAIKDDNTRGSTLTVLARDAAEAGNGQIVKKAVAGIPDGKQHENAAQSSAMKLAEKGQHEAATEVAKMIADEKLRDNVLRSLSAKK